MTVLRVHSMFRSIQGESTRVGLPTVFVRLAGCPLCCTYCDAAEARGRIGVDLSVEDILARLTEGRDHFVTVTGGEPLSQSGTDNLLSALCDAGYEVSLETSGAEPIERVDPRVKVVMDVKTPGSGMDAHLREENLAALKEGTDEIKFVVTSESDFRWSEDFATRHELGERCELIVSPAHGQVPPERIASWVLDSTVPFRLQLQLHKIIWPNGEPETMEST